MTLETFDRTCQRLALLLASSSVQTVSFPTLKARSQDPNCRRVRNNGVVSSTGLPCSGDFLGTWRYDFVSLIVSNPPGHASWKVVLIVHQFVRSSVTVANLCLHDPTWLIYVFMIPRG